MTLRRILPALFVLALTGVAAMPPDAALRPGDKIASALEAGGCVQVALPAGGVWLLTAEQRGVDLALTPLIDGIRQAKLDRPSGRRGSESLVLEVAPGQEAAVEVCAGGGAGSVPIALRDLASAGAGERAAWALDTRAAQAATRGDRRAAAELWQEAAVAWQRLRERAREADTRTWAAFSFRQSGEIEAARVAFQQARELWRELDAAYDEARVVNELGFLAAGAGRAEEALLLYREALGLWRRAGDVGGEARTLNNLALALHGLGRPREARQPYEQALAIFHQLGDRGREATALSNLAALATDLGEVDLARRRHRDALAIFRELADQAAEARVLINIAHLERQLGHFQDALDAAQVALELQRRLGTPAPLASTLNNLGEIYYALGDPIAARAALEEALIVDRAAGGERSAAGFIWHNLGRTALLEGGTVAALSSFERALELHRRQGDRRAEAETLLALADVHSSQGRATPAAEALAAAQTLAEAVGAPRLRLSVRSRQGEVALAAGDCPAAGRAADAMLELARQIDDRSSEAQALVAQGRWARRCDLLERAEQASLEALALLEALRADLVDLSLRATFLAERRRAFELAVDVLAARHAASPAAGFGARALALTEQARARAFLDLLEQAARETPAPAIPYEPMGEPAMRALLDRDTLLLDYWLGEESGLLFVLDVRGLAVHPLPPRAVVARRVRALLESWRNFDAGRPADRRAAAELTDLLLPPSVRQRGRRFALVLDGALHSLPFAALPLPTPADARAVLLDSHELVLLPSISVLAAQRRQPAAERRGIAVLADPIFDHRDPRVRLDLERAGDLPTGLPLFNRLPRSADEAAAIARWATAAGEPHRVEQGAAADAELLLGTALRGQRVVHLATHAVVDPREPARSSLILSLYDAAGHPRAGRLGLEQLSHLGWKADLVVLSGCGTALGREVAGEGLIGLARAFQMSGARRVLASLWAVDDRSTAVLMDAFYQEHLTQRLPPTAALRAAQRRLRAQRELADPFYWAPFVLIGDWR
jgi:CHAT domain-containing protein